MTTPVPPIGGHDLYLFLLQVALLLTVALLLGRLAVRFGLPPLVGELLTGVLLGPSLLGATAPQLSARLFPQVPAQVHLLDAFGQIGVLFLVGVTGTQLDLGLARRRFRAAASVSVPGFVVPLGLGIGVGVLLPATLIPDTSNRTVLAVFLGIAMSVSAIPVIAKTLLDMKLLHRNVGQLILICGTVDDLIGWIGLSVVTAMATTGLRTGDLLTAVGGLVAFLVCAALLGRPLVRAVMRRAAGPAEHAVTIAAAAAVILAAGALTQGLKLEAVLGALIAGLLIRGAGPEVVRRLAPLRILTMAVLAPVFFAIAGLRMDLTTLGRPDVLPVALVLLLVAIAGKFTGAMLGAQLARLNRWEALAVGAGMNSRGVIEIVVATVGLKLGVLDVGLYSVIVLIAVVTSLMGPPILRFAGTRIAESEEELLRLHETADAPERVN